MSHKMLSLFTTLFTGLLLCAGLAQAKNKATYRCMAVNGTSCYQKCGKVARIQIGKCADGYKNAVFHCERKEIMCLSACRGAKLSCVKQCQTRGKTCRKKWLGDTRACIVRWTKILTRGCVKKCRQKSVRVLQTLGTGKNRKLRSFSACR